MNWNQLIPTRRSLLNRIKQWDDRQSWQEFNDIYRPLIYGAAMKAGLTEEEAEDVVQETLIGVNKSISKFKYDPDRCSFKTWLHGVTKRQVANQYRKRQGKGRLLEPFPSDPEDVDSMDCLPDPASEAVDETWQREWEQNLLRAATERIRSRVSPAQFRIYDYLVLQDHSVSETARALNISAARVYLAKHRILSCLKQEIAVLRQ